MLPPGSIGRPLRGQGRRGGNAASANMSECCVRGIHQVFLTNGEMPDAWRKACLNNNSVFAKGDMWKTFLDCQPDLDKTYACNVPIWNIGLGLDLVDWDARWDTVRDRGTLEQIMWTLLQMYRDPVGQINS